MSKLNMLDIFGGGRSAIRMPEKSYRLGADSIWEASIDDHVISLASSPDGTRVAVAGISGAVAVIDSQTGRDLYRENIHSFGATMVSWSRDGKFLTSAGQDHSIRLYDAERGFESKKLDAGAPWAECVRWSPHADIFASTAGKQIKLWNSSGELVRTYPEQASTVVDLAWSPISDKFVTACYGGLTSWRSSGTTPVHRYAWKGSTLIIAWSPNGRYIATGDQDSTVHFWITKNGKDLQMYGYPTKVKELSWDSTGRFLATGGGGFITVWNCEPSPEGTTPQQLKGHQNYLSALAFQPSGHLLLSGDIDGKTCLWNISGGENALGSVSLPGEITGLSWSDNTRFTVSDGHGTVRMYEVI